jgi:hypothetical protein
VGRGGGDGDGIFLEFPSKLHGIQICCQSRSFDLVDARGGRC